MKHRQNASPTLFVFRDPPIQRQENPVDSASIHVLTLPLACWSVRDLRSDRHAAQYKNVEPVLEPIAQRGEEHKMRAAKLVQHMKANADRMSEEVLQKIRKSDKCAELVRKLPVTEQKTYTTNVYQDLTLWLGSESDTSIEHRYTAMGKLRSQQGIPFSNLYWAVCIAHEHLWQYMQQECLLDEPVEFWGGVILLRSLTQFFNRVLYFALLGYEQAAASESQLSPAGSSKA